jgi:hypothetical protein
MLDVEEVPDRLPDGTDRGDRQQRPDRGVAGERERRRTQPRAEGHHGQRLQARRTRVEPAQLDAEHRAHGQTAADPGDDARGGEESLEDARAGRDVEAREGVLDRPHEPDAREQHDDACGHDHRRVDVEVRGSGADRGQRGEQTARDLLVERRQPAPGHRPLEQVDAGCGEEGDDHDDEAAAQEEPDAQAGHPLPEGDRPAREAVA